MTKKYARFLPTTESFTLEDFPYYWITQVHAQYVQNIDNALKNKNENDFKRYTEEYKNLEEFLVG